MESWDSATPSPNLKFENSPAESFLSTPGEMYTPLFGSPSTTITPLEIMTPQSFSEDQKPEMSVLTGLTPAAEADPTPAPATAEKKSVKKRKSWGQVLPEPKTCLPPRKRAKTEDEKEQRRVERVLRNRRAAQSSRERKRQEVEALEQRNMQLEAMIRQYQQTNYRLIEELQKARRDSGVATPLRPTGVTFSQELFSSQDGHNTALQPGASIEDLLASVQTSNNTVNPASISPALTPVPEDDETEPATVATPLADTATNANTSPDATQHPAAMLCQDLQCRSAEESRLWQAMSPQALHPALALLMPLQILLISTSAMLSLCQRPLMQIAMSLKAGFSLPPTPSILNTILWLVTNPQTSRPRRTYPSSTNSTSTSSSTTSSMSPPLLLSSSSSSSFPAAAQSQTRRSSSLRLKFLRKVLTCSPNLARPLTDATMAALRLVSTEGCYVSQASDGRDGSAVSVASGSLPQQQQGSGGETTWLDGAALPSKEVLLTLLWAIKVEERRVRLRQRTGNVASKFGRRSNPGDTTVAYQQH